MRRHDYSEPELVEPYAEPVVHGWPDHWEVRARTNWYVFMKPVHDQLSDSVQEWYRRIYRPNISTMGVNERDGVEKLTESDFVAEVVATTVFEDRDFKQPIQRKPAAMRSDSDLRTIGSQIAHAVDDVLESGAPDKIPISDVRGIADGEPNIDLTPELLISVKRSPN